MNFWGVAKLHPTILYMNMDTEYFNLFFEQSNNFSSGNFEDNLIKVNFHEESMAIKNCNYPYFKRN